MFDNISFSLVRTLDIAYLSILQFTYAIIINICFDKLYLPQSEPVEKNQNIFIEFLFLSLIISILVTLAYLGRKIIKYIPSPFHSLAGFQHHKLKELGDISALTGFILLTSGIIKKRISTIRNYFGLDTQFLDIDKKNTETGITTSK